MSDNTLLNVVIWTGIGAALGLPLVRGRYALTARDVVRAIASDVPAIVCGGAGATWFLVAGVRHQTWSVVVLSPVLGVMIAEAVHAVREYWPWRRR